jgi:hypothetical protein
MWRCYRRHRCGFSVCDSDWERSPCYDCLGPFRFSLFFHNWKFTFSKKCAWLMQDLLCPFQVRVHNSNMNTYRSGAAQICLIMEQPSVYLTVQILYIFYIRCDEFFVCLRLLFVSCACMIAYPKASTSPASQTEHFGPSPESEEWGFKPHFCFGAEEWRAPQGEGKNLPKY